MKQIISIALSLLLLISSSGVAYVQHFCGAYEMISEITFGQKHLSCGMVMEDSGCGDEHTEDHDCCNNEYTQIATNDTTTTITVELSAPLQFVVSYMAGFELHIDLLETGTALQYAEYNPPPLIKDIPVLYETFLI